MAKVGRPPLPESEKRLQVAFRFPRELLEFVDGWGKARGWGRSETVFWMLTTVMRSFRVLGPHMDRLVSEEQDGGQSVGNALGVKALDTLLREESRAPPEGLRDRHRR